MWPAASGARFAARPVLAGHGCFALTGRRSDHHDQLVG